MSIALFAAVREALPETAAPYLAAFRKGLGETGFVEGQNVAIDARFAQTTERLAGLAADLVLRRVSVIATLGGPALLKSKRTTNATYTIFALSLRGAEPLVRTWSAVAGGVRRASPLRAPAVLAMARRPAA